MRRYLSTHPTGKQLALMMSLPVGGPVIYADSERSLFSGAATLAETVDETPAGTASYLPDCQLSADDRLFADENEKGRPVNTGFVIFRGKIDWSVACERFVALAGEPVFFTNQTLTHLVLHRNPAVCSTP